jgi:hypothetical protein
MSYPHPVIGRHPLVTPHPPSVSRTTPPSVFPNARPQSLPRAGPHAIAVRPAPAHPAAPPAHLPGAVPARRNFIAQHKWAAVAVSGLVVVAAAVTAAVLVRQDITTNPAAAAPDVRFETGTDYTAINTAGFATLTLGTSGASATLAISGIAGAALTSLTNVAQIHNTDATQAYTVTFARSATPNAAITDFTVTVKNGGTTMLTWNAVSAATSSSFTLAASADWDISVQLAVTDGTAAGSLGSFTMQASLVPV